MAQWGPSDVASNSVIWAPAGLNKAPTRAEANTLYGNTTANAYFNGVTIGQYGVSTSEAAASPVAHAGWQLRTVGSGGRAGRITHETLVAMGSITGDNDANTYPNFLIVIQNQPSNIEVADDAAASFSVLAVTAPPGQTITYQWQIDASANGTWTNVTNGGIYSGATSTTLGLASANSGLTGTPYRVVVAGANAVSVTSSPAVLTVV